MWTPTDKENIADFQWVNGRPYALPAQRHSVQSRHYGAENPKYYQPRPQKPLVQQQDLCASVLQQFLDRQTRQHKESVLQERPVEFVQQRQPLRMHNALNIENGPPQKIVIPQQKTISQQNAVSHQNAAPQHPIYVSHKKKVRKTRLDSCSSISASSNSSPNTSMLDISLSSDTPPLSPISPPVAPELCSVSESISEDTLTLEDGTVIVLEKDEHKIRQRMKQIGFGKSTKGYANYSANIRIEDRDEENEDHPTTPRADQKCSKRSWDGQLKKWRRLLHRWDLVEGSEEGSEKDVQEGTEGGTPDLKFSGRPRTEWVDDKTPNKVSSALRMCNLSEDSVALKLYADEPRVRSWGSECSECPDFTDLSGFSL